MCRKNMGAKSEDKIPPQLSELIISSCAGAILTSLFVTPLDVVKTRLQVQAKSGENVKTLCSPYNCLWDDLCFEGKCCILHDKSHFKGTLDAFIKIIKYEGVASLWSGLSPTLVMSVPATVLYFTIYDQIKEEISSKLLPSLGTYWVPILSGLSARVVTVTFVSPIEFLRTKLQSEQIKYSLVFKNFQELIKHRGIISLWHGWLPTIMRDAPFSAIYWTTYEHLKTHQGHPSFWKTFLFGALSGSVAATLTLPFDVVKTHLQSDLGSKELLKSLVPRLLKVAPACGIMISSYEFGKSYFVNKRAKLLLE